MKVHQSAMTNGSLRIVIEPLNKPQELLPWVPAEYAGNDFRQWQLVHFRIGRVTQDFQVLFEVVPPTDLSGQIRGHVSIDDLYLKGCYPEGVRDNTCKLEQLKCQMNRADVCLKPVEVCDIDVDCDKEEDEHLNCGMCS